MQNLNIYLEKMIGEQITEKSLDEALDLLQMVPEIQKQLDDPTASQENREKLIRKLFPLEIRGLLGLLSRDHQVSELAALKKEYGALRSEEKEPLNCVLEYVTEPTDKQSDGIIRFLKEKLGDCLSEETADSMEMIISSVETAKECEFNIKFDPTLVRGQSYYTGTIFEVTMDDFGGSVAGGGRYDKMIGKFTGQDTPACGFSIGFERIVMLLLENGYEVPTVKEKKAYLLEKKMTKEGLLKVMSLAKADRQAGKQVLIVNMKKNKKFQKEQLTEDGYTEIVDCYADSVENL